MRDGRAFSNKLVPALTSEKKLAQKSCAFSALFGLQMVKDLPIMQETWVRSLGREDPLEKGMATPLLFLPGEFHGQRRLAD